MKKRLFRDRVVPRVSRLITHHPLSILAGVLLLGGIFWSFLPQAALRPDVDDFMAVKDPSFELRRSVRALFPNNESVVIAVQDDSLFTPS